MARVTYVKKAQQRYKTVPVIDPETGVQKTTAVTRADGSPKTDKRGRAVVRRLTVEDKSQPLPNRKCDKCGKEIEVGQPYKWIAPKSGPYGGYKRYRCDACPTWNVWDYSNSLGARVAQISADAWEQFGNTTFESDDEFNSLLSEVAENIRGLAEEKEEGAQNIEDGFGHETSTSQELRDIAEQLNSWADDVENTEAPNGYPEPEETDCDECGGTGTVETEGSEETQNCEQCNGAGVYTPKEVTDEQIDEWRGELEDAFAIVDECPV